MGGYAYPEIDAALLADPPLPHHDCPLHLRHHRPGRSGPPGGPGDPRGGHGHGGAAPAPPVHSDEEGDFSNETAHTILTDGAVQNRLAASLLETISAEGVPGAGSGLRICLPGGRPGLRRFIARMRELLTLWAACLRGPGPQDLRRPAGRPVRGARLPPAGRGGGLRVADDL